MHVCVCEMMYVLLSVISLTLSMLPYYEAKQLYAYRKQDAVRDGGRCPLCRHLVN